MTDLGNELVAPVLANGDECARVLERRSEQERMLGIVGSSPALRTLLGRLVKVSPTESTVLITGETGTGKELVARAIHQLSRRSAGPFVSVNCAAIPPALVSSELFGHERGAFTGALQRRAGRFEIAQGGTLFLDEIGELPAETQVTLLRVLQEREFERVGSAQPLRADVRVVAATNRDLEEEIAAGRFRSDLFYRLNVFPLEMPPLRTRIEDVRPLAEHFLAYFAQRAGKRIRGIEPSSLALLEEHPWPGNVRELQNVIERAVIVCGGELLSIEPAWLARGKALASRSEGSGPATGNGTAAAPPLPQTPLARALAEQERAMIEAALEASRGRVSGPSGAATRLGMPPSTLDSKIRALRINKHQFKMA